jgi:signal transduction histidine kinase
VLDATPEDYTPPLTRWGHLWRLMAVLLTSGIAWSSVAADQWHRHHWLLALDLGLGLVAYPLMFFRRRYPLPIALILNVLSLGSGIASGPALLATVSLATRRVLWQIVLVIIVAIVAGQGFVDLQPGAKDQRWWVTFAFTTAVTIAFAAIGMYIGSRRELMWTLRERARQAEDQHGLRVDAARAAERERIAREMHDVLAHRISMVSMHAGALAYRTDLPPEQVRETAELIQAKAHEALTDLRQVLGVLRSDQPGQLDRPQPTLRDLPSLVNEARDAGMDVDLHVTTPDDGMPEQVARTVYRIVQEGLTNARKHALGTSVRVSVEGAAGPGVDVWVRNPSRVGGRTTTPGAGLGLVGLRERAELAGGRIDVSQEREGFALHGWLPWPA